MSSAVSKQHFTAARQQCHTTTLSVSDISVRLSASLTYDLISETLRKMHTVTTDPNGKSQAPDRSLSVPMTSSDLMDGTRGPNPKRADLRRCQTSRISLCMPILFDLERSSREQACLRSNNGDRALEARTFEDTKLSIRPYGVISIRQMFKGNHTK